MGDRAQVKIESAWKPEVDAPVYLYTHWCGAELIDVVYDALKRRWRWNDNCYLARIVFNEMQDGDRSELGWGIDTILHGDLSHPLIVLNCQKQTITVGSLTVTMEAFVESPDTIFAAYKTEMSWS